MVQLMPLHPNTPQSFALCKSRLVLSFWYRLTQFVLYVYYTVVVVVVGVGVVVQLEAERNEPIFCCAHLFQYLTETGEFFRAY